MKKEVKLPSIISTPLTLSIKYLYQDLRQSYLEIQHREKAAREEAKLYQKQMHEDRENSRIAVENMKRELNETKVRIMDECSIVSV